MNNIINTIKRYGFIPITKIDNINDVEPVCIKLIESNYPLLEITFRTDHALNAIKMVSGKFPEILIGAGTILNKKQAKQAIQSGAKFIVSPGLDKNVVKYCIRKKVLPIPGVLSATEVQEAVNLGLNVLKFFPAEPSGGLNYIESMLAPFDNVKFIPTGGINKNNLKEYLLSDKVTACGGSMIVQANITNTKKYNKISEDAEEILSIVNSTRK